MLRRSPGVYPGSVTLASSRAIPPWQSLPERHFIEGDVEGVERFHAKMLVRRIDPERPGASAAEQKGGGLAHSALAGSRLRHRNAQPFYQL